MDLFGLRALSDCEKKTFAPYFPGMNLDNIDLQLFDVYQGDPTKVGYHVTVPDPPFPFNILTPNPESNRIHVTKHERGKSRMEVMVHELQHVYQRRALGYDEMHRRETVEAPLPHDDRPLEKNAIHKANLFSHDHRKNPCPGENGWKS
jgi:hypothetical protein